MGVSGICSTPCGVGGLGGFLPRVETRGYSCLSLRDGGLEGRLFVLGYWFCVKEGEGSSLDGIDGIRGQRPGCSL